MNPSPLATVRQRPPALPHIVRPEPVGELVWWCELALEVCPTTNRTRGACDWQAARDKALLWRLLQMQARVRRPPCEPLSGRPLVLACRLSAVEPDAYSDWAKRPIDMLRVGRTHRADGAPLKRPTRGLGIIADDSPRHIDLRQWWEPAPRGAGSVVIEVWTGGERG